MLVPALSVTHVVIMSLDICGWCCQYVLYVGCGCSTHVVSIKLAVVHGRHAAPRVVNMHGR